MSEEKSLLEQGIELIRRAGEDRFPQDVYDWTLWTAPVVQSPSYLRDALQNLGFLGQKLTEIRLLSAWRAGERVVTDEPVVLKFESGDRLELEFVAGGTVRVSRSRLPRALKTACAFDPNERFAAVVGEALSEIEVEETSQFPANALYYEETLRRGETYISRVVLRFGAHALTLSCGLDEAELALI